MTAIGSRLRVLLVGFFLLTSAAGSLAAFDDWVQKDQHDYRLITGSIDNNQLRGLFQIRLEPGWKFYWRNAGDAGLSLSVDEVIYQNAKDLRFDWPVPRTFSYQERLLSYGYENQVSIPFQISIIEPLKHFSAQIEGIYSVCSDEVCIPQQLKAVIAPALEYEGHNFDRLIAKSVAQVPKTDYFNNVDLKTHVNQSDLMIDFDIHTDSAIRDVYVHSSQNQKLGHPIIERDSAQVRLRVPLSTPLSDSFKLIELAYRTDDGQYRLLEFNQPTTFTSKAGLDEQSLLAPSLLFSLLLAFLGGLILNLMPCMLPALGLKLSALKQEPHRARSGFLYTAMGIIASFLVLLLLILILRSFGIVGSLGLQFQHSSFVIFFMLIFLWIGYAQIGLTSISLPEKVEQKMTWLLSIGKSHSINHLTHGFLMTLLAASCSAPFLGGAVAFALTQKVYVSIAVFMVAALGLAFPYLLLALFSFKLTSLNISSWRWSAYLQYLIGGLNLILALWLLNVLAAQQGKLFSATVFILINGLILANLIAKRYLQLRSLKTAFLALWMALVISPIFYEYKAEPAAAYVDEKLVWYPFEASLVASQVAQGKIVLVDITAKWCLTCKFNEWNVFQKEEVQAHLSQPFIYLMRGDVTTFNSKIMNFVKDHGRAGIPFTAAFEPNGSVLLSELLSVDEILSKTKPRTRSAL